MIFDEVITGFRIAPGGAQSYYGVTPDIATLGKAMGGGLALSSIAGRREILELMFTGGVSFGGTFNGNPLSLAAGVTTIQELVRDGGEPLRTANRTGEELIEGIRQAGRPLRASTAGKWFWCGLCRPFQPVAAAEELSRHAERQRAPVSKISHGELQRRNQYPPGWPLLRFDGPFGKRCRGDACRH